MSILKSIGKESKFTKVFCNRCKRMTRLDGEYVCKQCAREEKLTYWGRG